MLGFAMLRLATSIREHPKSQMRDSPESDMTIFAYKSDKSIKGFSALI